MSQAEQEQFFARLFPMLSGVGTAYHWQEQLFYRFLEGNIPPQVSLPTGTGKTSVMDVWLLALAWQAIRGSGRRVPTRLVWVVDRRVVVDQATDQAESLVKKVDAIPELRDALGSLCLRSDRKCVLAVSTLRGEFADNREWSRDPLRPAIVVGTVDMVGSRLLFSGYGDSIRKRALHAALLGNDALVVNDEAHLTPAFAKLLQQVSEISGVRVMLLSATHREGSECSFPETLDSDLEHPVFEKRYRGVKRLHLCEHDEPKKEIVRLANEPGGRTLVFVRSPDEARKIAASIQAKHAGAPVALITGTQRGWERDQLDQNDAVQRCRSKQSPDRTLPAWLVATSAGEVGIDLSSDRVITDLDTADHMLQRFGRLNRFGETEGDAYVIYSQKQLQGDKAERLRATVAYLKTLPSASAESLNAQPPLHAALSPAPSFGPILPWHIDVWSMTSLSSRDWPARPAVEHWLRGEDDEVTPPETYIAWRADVEDLTKPGVAKSDVEEVFSCYPVIAQERLRTYSPSLIEQLQATNYLDARAILLAADGEVYSGRLRELLSDNERLHYATLVLPPGVGNLDVNGMVDWARTPQNPFDRYDKSATQNREHRKVATSVEEAATVLPRRYLVRIPAETEGEQDAAWEYFVARPTVSSGSTTELLDLHQGRVARAASEVARRSGLDERTVAVFEWAANWHDAGKARDLWQRAAGNDKTNPPVAKTERLNPRVLDGFRHELGSLIDCQAGLPEYFTAEERDLALYLIGAHHGWGRPHFPERAFDKENYRESERLALESARRFGRLQRRYGAWHLAYIESLFRSADAIVSSSETEFANA